MPWDNCLGKYCLRSLKRRRENQDQNKTFENKLCGYEFSQNDRKSKTLKINYVVKISNLYSQKENDKLENIYI